MYAMFISFHFILYDYDFIHISIKYSHHRREIWIRYVWREDAEWHYRGYRKKDIESEREYNLISCFNIII